MQARKESLRKVIELCEQIISINAGTFNICDFYHIQKALATNELEFYESMERESQKLRESENHTAGY
jgi:hypothetical protein